MVVKALQEYEDLVGCSRKCIIGFTYVWCKKNYIKSKYNNILYTYTKIINLDQTYLIITIIIITIFKA